MRMLDADCDLLGFHDMVRGCSLETIEIHEDIVHIFVANFSAFLSSSHFLSLY